MCMAITKPADAVLDIDDLRRAFDRNDQGWGIGYPHEGGLWFQRSLDDKFDYFIEEYEKVKHLPLLIHFRLVSKGNKSLENCHPFPVGDNLLMAHNGTIPCLGDGTKSDTRQLALMLQSLPIHDLLSNEGFLALLAMGINGSRLAFMLPNSEFIRVGDWEEHSGAWWSNSGYKEYKTYAKADTTWYNSGNESYAGVTVTGTQRGPYPRMWGRWKSSVRFEMYPTLSEFIAARTAGKTRSGYNVS